MAAQGGRLQYIRQHRLLGALGALVLGSCGGSGDVGEVRAGPFELTSQWFFETDITDRGYCAAPYNNDGRNSNDGIYTASLVFTLTLDAANGGYVRVFTIYWGVYSGTITTLPRARPVSM